MAGAGARDSGAAHTGGMALADPVEPEAAAALRFRRGHPVFANPSGPGESEQVGSPPAGGSTERRRVAESGLSAREARCGRQSP